MLQVLLKVADLAGLWNCSRDYIYRRLNPSHPQFIPHKRLPSGDVRFDEQELAGYLKSSDKQVSFPMSGSSVREGIRMTRNRDRKGSLLLRGRERKFWLVQWPEGDRRLSHKLGWRDEMNASQAERARRQWIEKINSRRDVAGDSVTLEGFFHEHYWQEESSLYGDELSTKKPSTRRDMKNVILQVLLPHWGKRNMDSLRTGEIQSFLAGRIGHESGKVSRQTALKWKIYLSSMFTAAIRLEAGVTRNPVRGVKLPAAEREELPACMSIKQAVEILEKLEDPRHRIAWQLAMWTGSRCGELRGLRWSSVNWEQGSVVITESVWEGHSTQPKTRKGYRRVVLTPNQIDSLRKYKEQDYPNAGPNDWVLPGKRGRPIDMNWVMKHHVTPVAQTLGIEGTHWLALRHLNNSIMVDESVDIATRKDRLGHASDDVNLIYSHAGDKAQLAASQAIEKRLEAVQEEVKQRLTVTQTVTQRPAVSANY
jgi:integrase